MAAAGKEAKEATAEAPKAGGGNKFLIIGLAAAVLLLVISMSAAVFFALRSSHASSNAEASDSASSDSQDSGDDDSGHKKKDKGKKGEKSDKDGKKLPAQYLDLAPAFVVNVQDDQASRFLQIEAQVMTRDPKEAEEIKTNMPRIRNALILLFSQQHVKELTTREAKEALQQQALEQVQGVMKDETGKPCVEAIYFTNFVIQ